MQCGDWQAVSVQARSYSLCIFIAFVGRLHARVERLCDLCALLGLRCCACLCIFSESFAVLVRLFLVREHADAVCGDQGGAVRLYFLERVGVGRCSEERRHVAHILVLLIWYGGGELMSCLPKESLWPGMGEGDGPWENHARTPREP